ncbi:MAG TPA: AAA family ATPase [Kofleriaceae bacterium]
MDSVDARPEFDLFVLHAAADVAFVRGYLLPAIAVDEADPRIMLPSKYELGSPTLSEVERAVRRSAATLLVVSRAARGDRWAELGGVLAGTLGATGAHRLIPLLLDDAPVDLAIGALESLRFADRALWDAEAARLRRLLERAPPAAVDIACPYPGLRAFEAGDRERFFGRDRQVRELAQRVEDGARMLCIIGPSGSGKSSLVLAGVLPRLERSGTRDGFAVCTMRPGADPAAQLARALAVDARDGSGRPRVALFIDQLEELFTLAAAPERARFIAAIHALRGDPRCSVLAALRADFCGAVMDSELWPDVEYSRCEVVPLRGAALRDAIALPAASVGVTLEPELVERLAADAAAEPGALPLLQATRVELWDAFERRGGGTSTHRYLALADYERIGEGRTGIASALAHRADIALAELTPGGREVARRVLLALVSFGDGRAHTRRQQSIGALRELEDPGELDAALRVLVARRLVTTGSGPSGPTIDLAHEALLTAWPTLRAWIDTHRVDEERKRALAAKVAEWKDARRSGFHDAKLLDAAELPDAERYLAHIASRAGLVPELEQLVARSRAELDAIRRERDRAHRLLAMSYQERGRQLLLEGRTMQALPYLHAARAGAGAQGAVSRSLRMMFAQAARTLPAVALAHRAPIERAAFSPDGRWIATASRDHTAAVWDVDTGAAVLGPLEHDGAVLDVAFSPDGARLVTASADHSARIWSLPSGEPVALLAHDAKVHLACFSNDGGTLLTASWDHTARVWSATAGTPISPPIRHGGKITCARFSPDGRRIAIAGAHRAAQVCDGATGEPVFALAHADMVREAVFSTDGARILTASADGTARVWDAATGAALGRRNHDASVAHAAFGTGARVMTAGRTEVRVWNTDAEVPELVLAPPRTQISAAALSPDGRYLAIATFDGAIQISSGESGLPVAPELEQAHRASSAAFSPSGHRFAAVLADGTVRVWDVERACHAAVPVAHAKGWLTCVAFDRDGAHLLTAGKDHTARLWHTATGAPIGPALRHDHELIAALFAPDGNSLVTVGGQAVTLWSAITGQRIRAFEHAHPVCMAAFRADAATLATADREGHVKIWDLRDDRPEPLRVHVHGSPVTGVWFSPDGAHLLSTCADGLARLWREGCAPCARCARTGVDARDRHAACVRHDETVTHAAFDRDGARIATASRDRTARVWALDGRPCSPPLRHDEEIRRVAFSPDGTRVITTSGAMVRVWDAASGQPVLDPLAHPRRVHAARFSPDGALVATACDDGNVRLWDAATGRPIAPPLTHPRRVNDLAFSPDGAYLATASGDPIARIWELARDDRSLAQWSELVTLCPYELVDAVLVERRIQLSFE